MKKSLAILIFGLMSATAQAEPECTWDNDRRGNGNKGTVRIGDMAMHLSTKEGGGDLYAQVESLTCGDQYNPPTARLRITECSYYCGTRDPKTKVKFEEGAILYGRVGAKDSSAFGVLYAWAKD